MPPLLNSPWRATLLAAAILCGGAVGAHAQATTPLSAYLIGRVALERGDLEMAAKGYGGAYDAIRHRLSSERAGMLLHTFVHVLVASGQVEEALQRAGEPSRLGRHRYATVAAARYVDAMRRRAFGEARAEIAFLGPIGDLLSAWAFVGERQFEVARRLLMVHAPAAGGGSSFLNGIAQYQLGLVTMQDPASAVTPNWTMAEGYRQLGPSVALAQASRLPASEARTQYFQALQRWPSSLELRTAFLQAYEPNAEARTVNGPIEGAAEALLNIGQLAATDRRHGTALIYLQLAHYLRSDDPVIALALGNELLAHDLGPAAHTVYQRGGDGVIFAVASAEALEHSGQVQRAVEELSQFGYRVPQDALALYHIGELYRRQENFGAAQLAYDQTLARVAQAEREIALIEEGSRWQEFDTAAKLNAAANLSDETRLRLQLAYLDVLPFQNRRWQLYFARGVSHERLGQWPAAEVDLLRALDMRPDDPIILNYLGYSWADQGINLDRSLRMLERAAAVRPNDGAIADSVGWARYKLGDYEQALVDLERAVELLPGEAEIIDHLGDVLWRLDRRDEARVYWRRALTWDPEDKLRDSIKVKLRDGLDAASP